MRNNNQPCCSLSSPPTGPEQMQWVQRQRCPHPTRSHRGLRGKSNNLFYLILKYFFIVWLFTCGKRESAWEVLTDCNNCRHVPGWSVRSEWGQRGVLNCLTWVPSQFLQERHRWWWGQRVWGKRRSWRWQSQLWQIRPCRLFSCQTWTKTTF